MTGLRADSLTLVRGERRLFADLSFTVGPGEALLLLGPNGTGKTSLLRLLAGLLKPEQGRVLWQDTPIDEDPEAFHRALSFAGHLDAVKPVLTVAENLQFWARLHGGDRVAEALDRFGLAALADIPARFLSAGQKRRLGLARIIAAPAHLWLLDEPTVSLDAGSVAALMAAVAAHRQAGGSVVAATHADLGLDDARSLDFGSLGR